MYQISYKHQNDQYYKIIYNIGHCKNLKKAYEYLYKELSVMWSFYNFKNTPFEEYANVFNPDFKFCTWLSMLYTQTGPYMFLISKLSVPKLIFIHNNKRTIIYC